MSELKARTARSIADEEEMLELGADSPIESAQVYLKYEADKVIADLEESHKMEVEQLLMEIAELKEKYKELAKLHDKAIQACCDADKVIAHQKYKRCLAMAYVEWLRQMILCDHPESILYRRAARREHKWKELAEKLKEAK